MRHNWYIIDRWGRRSINFRRDTYWSRFDYGGIDIDWPAFSQFVTRASPEILERALSTFAEMLEVQLVDVTDDPAMWDGALLVARNGGATCVAEPGLDLDDRLLRPESANAVAGLLADDGAFFGFDPAAGTIHVTRYEMGAPSLEWFDSTEPGPSYARTFQTNGRATDEDPRAFALRYLDLPESSPLLDRIAFVEAVLDDLELERVAPELDELPVESVLRLAPANGSNS
jgi:hypothetical protein